MDILRRLVKMFLCVRNRLEVRRRDILQMQKRELGDDLLDLETLLF